MAIYSKGHIKTEELRQYIQRLLILCNNGQQMLNNNFVSSGQIPVRSLSLDELCTIVGCLNSQSKASIYEAWLLNFFHLMSVSPKENRGDGVSENKEYYEIKISSTNTRNVLNIRQIRLYQQLNYYIVAYFDELFPSKSKCFLLTHEEMKEECKKRGSFSHGVKNIDHSHPEYSISFALESKTMDEWVNKYQTIKLHV